MNCTSQRRCHGMTRDKHVHPRSPEGVHGIDECILDYGQTWSLPLSYNNFKVALVTSSAEDPVQVVFTSPQVASWTHTGLHLGLTDTGCWHTSALSCGDLVVSRTRRRIGDRAFYSMLPHHEHGTGRRQTWSCCNRQTYFGVNWKYSCLGLFSGTKEQTGLLRGAPSVY